MKDKIDLATLLMAIVFLHIYRAYSKEELLLLLTADSYKKSLIMAPYSDGFKYSEMNEKEKHTQRILTAHILAYEEVLRKC